jgi:hypothetical protein
MAALPKRGALPQHIMVARAKTKGEIFMGCLLYRKMIFPSIVFVRAVEMEKAHPLIPQLLHLLEHNSKAEVD